MAVTQLRPNMDHWQERVDLAAAFRWTERLNFGVRYQPGYAKALNLRYRYSRDAIEGLDSSGFEDVDVSGQWPTL